MQPELTETNFNAEIDRPGKVLVEFFATWCPHCQRQQPITDEVAALLQGSVPVFQVDVDKCPGLTAEYAPNGFPTYVLFEGGTAVAHQDGECSLNALERFVGTN